MLKILAVKKDLTLLNIISLEDLEEENILWYWVDFNIPTEEEISLLDKLFKFHHLAIEDCTNSLSSPKLSYYDEYNFFVLNSLNEETLKAEEICLFVNDKFIVSFHNDESDEIEAAWERVRNSKDHYKKGPTFVVHQILDKIVDHYFPAVYKIEEQLNSIESNDTNKPIHDLIDEVFQVRSDLLKLRRIINYMRDLLYRILNSERLQGFEDHKLYFSDVYEHLVKLADMAESSREMTSDMRDSYLSLNSSHMNQNMMVLTVITTIFIPLTFIVGVYGMNFQHMPELGWKYGYMLVLIIMAAIGTGMFVWFKKKGWFNN